jgi:hypothetical protein
VLEPDDYVLAEETGSLDESSQNNYAYQNQSERANLFEVCVTRINRKSAQNASPQYPGFGRRGMHPACEAPALENFIYQIKGFSFMSIDR